jgi:polar amino acid transport system substrate-binding protein
MPRTQTHPADAQPITNRLGRPFGKGVRWVGRQARWVVCSALALLALPLAVSAQAPTAPTAPPPLACTGLLASGNPQYAPYLWRESADSDTLVGANALLMAWLAQEIGVPIEVRHVGPWSRVQEEARAGRVDLIAGAFFNFPRTEYLDYVYPAFRETRSVVLVREARPLTYRRWEDLVKRQGLTVVNNSFGEEFDRFMRERLTITRVASLEQALRMLDLGRGDYLLYEDSPAEAFMGRLGIKGLRALQPPVAQEQLHLALSHKSACNTPELRGALSRAMYKLRREKLMEGFVQQGVQRWRSLPPLTEAR